MKKKAIIIVCLSFFIILSIIVGLKLVNYLRIKNAKIEVVLVDDLNIEFNSKIYLSELIKDINGSIKKDKLINTTKLGEKEIKFDYINDDGIKVNYKFTINIKDTVPPIIWLNDTYNVSKNSDINLTEKILCGDNYDSSPQCFIEGQYDLNTVGEYALTFKAIDNSGNETDKDFLLNVYQPSKKSGSSSQTKTYFNDVLANYKSDNTKIGIDVSSWQGDIDFEKLKNAGVEFIIIRVGGTTGIDGNYFLDKKFIQNITLANQFNIDVGIYFYSYANTVKKAQENAKWVLSQIKDYKIDLPIAFDWEEWANFNKYNLSFFNLTSMAEEYINVIEKAGYKGMLYSSKNYLEKIWLPNDFNIWLAHYTKKTNYEGHYEFWQMCNDGRVDGINGAVDIDIMYIN